MKQAIALLLAGAVSTGNAAAETLPRHEGVARNGNIAGR
jgi:hypothetical protein